MSRVARKREAARERLVDAALEMIADGGVESITLRGVTDRADIGFGSFYSHFASKEDLVEAVATEMLGELTQSIIEEARALDDPAEQVALAHRRFIRVAYDDPRLGWLIVHRERADALLESASIPRFGPVLEEGVERGRFSPLDVDVAISFVVGATVTVMRSILEGRLGPGADAASARTLLRACGLSDADADAIASRPLA